VRVEDHTDRETPLGKQVPDWYTSVSGIWQTVWLEATGAARIESFQITPLADEAGVPTGVVAFRVALDRDAVREPLQLELRSRNRAFTAARFGILETDAEKTFRLTLENPRLWSPSSPLSVPVRAAPAVGGWQAGLRRRAGLLRRPHGALGQVRRCRA
jgi:hypothetical protein